MPSQEYIERLQAVIRERHSAEPKHLTSVYVWEAFERETVWEGVVQVFELAGHPTATRCYAWIDREDEVVCILESDPVSNASDAVKSYRDRSGPPSATPS